MRGQVDEILRKPTWKLSTLFEQQRRVRICFLWNTFLGGNPENPFLGEASLLGKPRQDPHQRVGFVDLQDQSKTESHGGGRWIPGALLGGFLDGDSFPINGVVSLVGWFGAESVGCFGGLGSWGIASWFVDQVFRVFFSVQFS